MERKRLYHIIEAEVTFTRPEYTLLIELAKRHYDGKCQAAGYAAGEKQSMGRLGPPIEHRVNGFLAQLKLFPDRSENGNKKATSTVMWPRENFDLTLKILEQRDMIHYSDRDPLKCQKKLDLANKIDREIRSLMQEMMQRSAELNPR